MIKWNYLMRLAGKIASGVALLSVLIIASCKEDEPEIKTVTVDFSAPSQTINENGGPQNLTIEFSGDAGVDGELDLVVTPANAADFVSIPATVSITKGNSAAQITVTPVNNATIDGAKQATITIANPTEGFKLGTQTTFTLNIADDEGEVTANFETAEAEIAEDNAEGVAVSILLSDAADEAGTIVVSFAAENAAFFTSDPAFSGTSITIPVAASATSASFTVIPVDDEVDNEDRVIDFTISNTTGGVAVGTSTTYALTITNDDGEVLTTIADVRALHTGSNVEITENLYVQGVITSSNDNVTIKNIYVQDATGGIVLRFNEDNTFARGDEVRVNIQGATISEFNGLMQVGTNLPNSKAEKVGDGTLPDYEVITIEQLNTGNYESRLVKIENIGFFDGNGVNNLGFNGGNGSGNNKIGDAAGNISYLRVESYAPFDTDLIPVGLGDVMGIASQTSLGNLLVPQSGTDIFAINESAIVTVDPVSLDFGDVANGAEADLAFEVSGTSLIGDVVITTPNNYSVSLDDVSYGSTVTVTASAAMAAPVTVHVRFAPSIGIDQAITGVVTIKSLSSSVKGVDVTGNETGNGGSTLLLDEQFDYGGTAGILATNTGAATTGLSGTWNSHSGTGSILYSNSSLTMASYPGSGTGGSAQIPDPVLGEDANRAFPEQTNGTVYVSALVQLQSAAATGTYFFHLKDGTSSGFVARVYAQDAGGGQFKIGFGKATGASTTAYTTELFDYGVTYVLVIKQVLDGNSTNSNDVSSLYVLNAVEATEPGSPTLTDATGTDRVISSIAIRQATGSPAGAIIDGIRVALNWNDLFN